MTAGTQGPMSVRPAPGTIVAARGQSCCGVVLAVDDLAALHHTPTSEPARLRDMTPVRWDGEEISWERTADLQPYAQAVRESEQHRDMAHLAQSLPGGALEQERER